MQRSTSDTQKTRGQVLAAARAEALSMTALSRQCRRQRLSVDVIKIRNSVHENIASSVFGSSASKPHSGLMSFADDATDYALSQISCTASIDGSQETATTTSDSRGQSDQSDSFASDTENNTALSSLQHESNVMCMLSTPNKNVKHRKTSSHRNHKTSSLKPPTILNPTRLSSFDKTQERNRLNAFEHRSRRKVSFSDEQKGNSKSSMGPQGNLTRQSSGTKKLLVSKQDINYVSNKDLDKRQRKQLPRDASPLGSTASSTLVNKNRCTSIVDDKSFHPKSQHWMSTLMFECYNYDFDGNSIVDGDGEEDGLSLNDSLTDGGSTAGSKSVGTADIVTESNEELCTDIIHATPLTLCLPPPIYYKRHHRIQPV